MIELPVQFKRLPCTIEKKIEIKLAKNFKLIRNCNHIDRFSNIFCERTCLYDFDSNVENETVILTLNLDKNHTITFEIRKGDEQKTQMFKINPSIKFEKKCPTFIFGKDYCDVNYHKEGLQWNLKDINGNVKIPFKISFDKEIYIGEAALEHPEFLLSGIDLEMLLNPKMNFETDLISLNENHEYEIFVKCFDGTMRITTVKILATFLKSILNLLEQNLNEEVKEIYWTAPNFCKQTMDKVFESLKIVAEFKNEQVIPENEKSTPNVTGYIRTNEIYSTTMAIKELSLELWKNDSSLLETYEQKLDEYMSCESNSKKVAEKIYDREFIELKREINKLSSLFECPLSVDRLKRFGIDRLTVLQSIKQKSGIIPNQRSSQKNDTLIPKRISKRNLKVSKKFPQKYSPNDKRIRKIRGILNKITTSNFGELGIEIINMKLYKNLETLPKIVDLIFTKAVEEPTFAGIYSDFCRLQHEVEAGGTNFHGAVVRKCQQVFEGTQKTSAQQGIENIEEKLKTEDDPKKREALQEDLEELQGKQKRYMLGTIKFISHLFRNKLINWRIIFYCLASSFHSFLENVRDELAAECFLNLLESAGLFMQWPMHWSELDCLLDYMINCKPIVSNRVKFMIMDLEDLRNNGWESKPNQLRTNCQGYLPHQTCSKLQMTNDIAMRELLATVSLFRE